MEARGGGGQGIEVPELTPFDFPSRRKTDFEATLPRGGSGCPGHPQSSLTKWIGPARAPLFDSVYCLFAINSELVFKRSASGRGSLTESL